MDDPETGLRDWLRMFGAPMLDAVPLQEQEEILAEIERRAKPTLFRDGRWIADYRRLRVRAVKQTKSQ